VKEATTMVVVGADVHKRTHTFVAVDEVGRQIGEKVVKATTAGHAETVANDRRYQYVPTYILRGLTELHLEFTPA